MDNNLIETVKSAISGDKKALEELIKHEQNNIYSTLYYLKKSNDEISDIIQDILIKLTNKITQLKNPNSFKSWLNQIILNSYFDYLRKNKKNSNLTYVDSDDKFDKADYSSNPQNSVLYSELDMIIRNSIENLPIHYRVPIALREVQGLSYSDISSITKTSVGTVKSRIARARNIIQEKILRYTDE